MFGIAVLYVQMTKLTLSVDEEVVRRAKRYAQSRGTSVSRLVEKYLDLVTRKNEKDSVETPSLRQLRGILRKPTGREAHRKHLARKYR